MKTNKIRIVATDIDGVLTNGKIFFINGQLHRFYNIKDGPAFHLLRLAGIKTAVISGKRSIEAKKRFIELGVDLYLEGVQNKLLVVQQKIIGKGAGWEELCYIGDDLPDLAVMKKAGFSTAPADAVTEVKRAASLVCKNKGGGGVFRETAEIILKGSRRWSEIKEKYLSLCL